jgi:UDP-glucose 4-epimerase
MKLLVTGAAGYVGSVVAALLLGRGHDVTVLDNLSRGHRAAIPSGADFVDVDLRDAAAVEQATDKGFDGALHFAALALVGESVEHPERYWQTNVGGTRNLLDGLTNAKVPRLVFSSTCAVYGTPDKVPMDEQTALRPESPYGRSKLAVDMMIHDECVAHGLNATSLRYFNVAGAHGRFGERHAVETHLIPLVLQVASGQRERAQIFGDDWPTPDGTCIRDYIHVDDLAAAHLLALTHAVPGEHAIYNLGSGAGFSVREVVEACRTVTGHPIPADVVPRRAGDPAVLVASSAAATEALGWHPEKTDLLTIVADAWRFAQERLPV